MSDFLGLIKGVRERIFIRAPLTSIVFLFVKSMFGLSMYKRSDGCQNEAL